MINLSTAEISARIEQSKNKQSLTIDELSILLERNKHKFIFYRYFGGMGGEFILNYLADNSPNIISQKDSTLMQDFYMMGWDFKSNSANKHYFADTIFGHYFLYAGEKEILKDTSEKWATNFKELAERIITDQKGLSSGYPEHDFNSLLELDKNEDMRYLVKIHNFYDELKLFKGAKMINTAPVEWKKHCSMICIAKNETNCVYTKNDKKNRIERLWNYIEFLKDDPFLNQHEYKHEKSTHLSIETATKYLSNIIENDNIPLYDNTINMALQPNNYALDMSTISAEEINNIETLRKLYFSKFIDEENTDEDVFDSYIAECESEYPTLNEYEITEYDYNDIANGEWIADEFGLDVEKFKNTFDDWFDKNIELLNKLELYNHYIPKKSSYIPRSDRVKSDANQS
jgi:hypothetical protein